MLEFNESDAFYIWIYIMENLKYKKVFDETLSKLRYHLKMVEEHLKCAFPNVYDILINDLGIDLSPIFTSIVQTIFIADLQHESPEIASHIFDVFLVDGESVVYSLITKFIALKEHRIYEYEDNELIIYIKQELPKECFAENTMLQLLDADAGNAHIF